MTTVLRLPRKYVPKLVRDGLFEGHVLLKQINAAQRADYMDLFNFEQVGDQMKTKDKLSSMQKVFISICTDVVVELKLKRLEDGQEFTSPDDLNWEEDLYPMIQDIAQHVINPTPLSKNLKV
jgi:hypothetical protein